MFLAALLCAHLCSVSSTATPSRLDLNASDQEHSLERLSPVKDPVGSAPAAANLDKSIQDGFKEMATASDTQAPDYTDQASGDNLIIARITEAISDSATNGPSTKSIGIGPPPIGPVALEGGGDKTVQSAKHLVDMLDAEVEPEGDITDTGAIRQDGNLKPQNDKGTADEQMQSFIKEKLATQARELRKFVRKSIKTALTPIEDELRHLRGRHPKRVKTEEEGSKSQDKKVMLLASFEADTHGCRPHLTKEFATTWDTRKGKCVELVDTSDDANETGINHPSLQTAESKSEGTAKGAAEIEAALEAEANTDGFSESNVASGDYGSF